MADEKTLTLVLKARNLASREVGKLGSAFDTAGTKAKGFGGVLKTLGKIGVFALITAFVAAIGVIGKATDMAKEEEKGIARLDAALKQNVKGWDGNRDAIEATIVKREKLAFSDDELRDSLGTLVTATGDVDKALALQATAMDLARLKHIPLNEASKLLLKAQGGNLRALKELGLELPKTATKQQILGAIQDKAAGQAAAYGKTGEAAQIRFQNAVDNLMEDLGTFFLPILKDVASFMTETLIPAVRDIATKVGDWLDKHKPLVDALKSFTGTVLQGVIDGIGLLAGAIGTVVDALISVVTWVKEAIEWLGKMNVMQSREGKIGPDAPYHPQYNPTGRRAMGGPVPPKSFLVGEKGMEMYTERGGHVTPNHKLGGGPVGPFYLIVDGKQLALTVVPAVSRQMFYELQRVAPTQNRA